MNLIQFAAVAAMVLLAFPPAAAQTSEQAGESVQQAVHCLASLEQSGISSRRAADVLDEAQKRFSAALLAERLSAGQLSPEEAEAARSVLAGAGEGSTSFGEVAAFAADVCRIRDEALFAHDSLRAFEESLQEYKKPATAAGSGLADLLQGMFFSPEARRQAVDTSEAEALLARAREAFSEERYEDASLLLREAYADLEEKEAQVTALNLLSAAGRGFLDRYWIELILLSVLCGAAGMFGLRLRSRQQSAMLARKLTAEHAGLQELMRRAQDDRFRRGTLTDAHYRIKMEKYASRLAAIEQRLPVVKARVGGQRDRENRRRRPA